MPVITSVVEPTDCGITGSIKMRAFVLQLQFCLGEL